MQKTYVSTGNKIEQQKLQKNSVCAACAFFQLWPHNHHSDNNPDNHQVHHPQHAQAAWDDRVWPCSSSAHLQWCPWRDQVRRRSSILGLLQWPYIKNITAAGNEQGQFSTSLPFIRWIALWFFVGDFGVASVDFRLKLITSVSWIFHFVKSSEKVLFSNFQDLYERLPK